jgi:hypothetical protein
MGSSCAWITAGAALWHAVVLQQGNYLALAVQDSAGAHLGNGGLGCNRQPAHLREPLAHLIVATMQTWVVPFRTPISNRQNFGAVRVSLRRQRSQATLQNVG